MTLDKNKKPDYSTYELNEQKIVEDKLIILPAYDESDYDLYSGWIRKAEIETKNIDAHCIFRQYGKLIKKLGENNMDTQLLEKFHNEIKKTESYDTALSIKKMLEEMPKYLAFKIKQKFENKPAPFQAVLISQNIVVAYFNKYEVKNANFTIDIHCSIDKFSLSFFDRNFNSKNNNVAEEILQSINYTDEFLWRETRFYKNFKFPTEEQIMYEFIDKFLEQLNKIKK